MFYSRALSLLFLLVASPFFLTIARALRSQPIAQDHTTCTFPSCMQFYPTRKKPSYSCIHQLLAIVLLREGLVLRLYLRFVQIWIFFLLKLSTVCTFWIVLMCWCQKWFLKNKKTSLACISARKAIWKAPATTLSNTF